MALKKKTSLENKTTVAAKKVAIKKVTAARTKFPTQNSLLRTVRAASARGKKTPIKKPHQLERHESNPIIEPREGNYWEMKATFNPGAVYADRRVHLLYRAIGGDD